MSTDPPEVPALLDIAVTTLGGKRRDGQHTMAAAVAHSIDIGEHLAVQAGTGTGKSLAYLVPALRQASITGKTVVVSTATIALQRQLVERDLPRLAAALKDSLGTVTFAILKGRNNYLCLNKLHSGMSEEPAEDGLFDVAGPAAPGARPDPFAASRMGREVTRIRDWSSDTETGDRDEVVPGVSDASWRQASVSARECLGEAACPFGTDCYAEKARRQAGSVHVVVTNHALLAIDAMTEVSVLPDHDVVIIDEAHELVDRVTSVATAELHPRAVMGAARRIGRLVEDEIADRLIGAGEALEAEIAEAPERLWQTLPETTAAALAAVRDAASAARTAIGADKRDKDADPAAAAARRAAKAALDDLIEPAVRIISTFSQSDPAARHDVVWAVNDQRRGGTGPTIMVAPLSVGGLLRSRLFAESTVILTSATLTIGGAFDALAITWGLPRIDSRAASTPDPAMANGKTAAPAPASAAASPTAAPGEPGTDAAPIAWSHLDVGSPFDHARSGILYVAKHLPAPGRDGTAPATTTEIAELIGAAGGRTLGLFSSIRAAKAAAEAVRELVDTPILCQGDDAIGQLVKRFAADQATSLFGTLTLWQGVDVPGPSLSLVLIDRIPFPRPDDPLATARQNAVSARGGNGFMTISASHAALLLAQGVGRLLRSVDDRGVVAVLDSRLATARYGGFLRASLPPFYETTDPARVRQALARLAAAAP